MIRPFEVLDIEIKRRYKHLRPKWTWLSFFLHMLFFSAVELTFGSASYWVAVRKGIKEPD